MPRLTELHPWLIKYHEEMQDVNMIDGDQETWRERGCPSHVEHRSVEIRTEAATIQEAHGVQFLCPLCFEANKGEVGTHLVEVTFADRNVPNHLGTHNKDGKAVRWGVSGTSFDTMTTTPSILVQGGCNWHGYITNGEAK